MVVGKTAKWGGESRKIDIPVKTGECAGHLLYSSATEDISSCECSSLMNVWGCVGNAMAGEFKAVSARGAQEHLHSHTLKRAKDTCK